MLTFLLSILFFLAFLVFLVGMAVAWKYRFKLTARYHGDRFALSPHMMKRQGF